MNIVGVLRHVTPIEDAIKVLERDASEFHKKVFEDLREAQAQSKKDAKMFGMEFEEIP